MKNDWSAIIKFPSFIIICLFLILLPGCLDDNNEDDNDFNEFEYLLEITTTSENEYTIISPLVVNYQDENVSMIMDQIEVSGDCRFTIEQTMYGPGINITGKGDLIIKSKGNRFVEYGVLSLKFDSDGDGIIKDEGPNVNYWYYYKTQVNMTIKLKINCQIKHGSSFYSSKLFETEISFNGWDKTNGEESIAFP